jgi:hypothetical protein
VGVATAAVLVVEGLHGGAATTADAKVARRTNVLESILAMYVTRIFGITGGSRQKVVL